jgi:8-oxo-dGTP pyrophosphatase MutT (NUDIX family)
MDEPLYCVVCGKEDCTEHDPKESKGPYCFACGVIPAPGGACAFHTPDGNMTGCVPAFVKRSSLVLVMREDRRLLVVSRKDGSGFALPGGKAEEGESPKITACRELHEEVGAMTTPGRLVRLYEGLSSSGSGRLVTLYYAHKITGEPHAAEYGTTIGWFDFDGLLNSSPFAGYYKQAFPDGIDHLRASEILVL